MNGDLSGTGSANAGAPLHRRTSRLIWLYVCALTAVALLSLTGQLLVQRSLHRQRASDSDRRQRALEIEETLELWKRSHLSLRM